MAQKEYIITVADPKIWDEIWDVLTIDGLSDNYIPKRAVEVANERPFNDYCAHFYLTDNEASQIRNDSRIQAIELQADLQENIKKDFAGTRTGLYDKNSWGGIQNNTMKNWGLLRCTNQENPFSNSYSVTGNYNYNLDGTGVDIVLVDSGIEHNHPEFAVNPDGTGGSRVVDFDWSSLGVPGTPTSAEVNGYLGDSNGHGTHVAGIAAGNTQGWASGARIYSIRIFSGYDTKNGGNFLGAISSDIAFDLTRAFHLQKVAAGGNVRPTICTNSWGYLRYYMNMTETYYRGTWYWKGSTDSMFGQIGDKHPTVVEYLDASVNNCSDAGVIMVGGAGNYKHKADIPGGLDYNNKYRSENGNVESYYHRGMSPTRASKMICVGAVEDGITERKAYYSETGPRIDIFAPGTSIMSSYNTGVPDSRNSNFYLKKLLGTSMACPQVTGVLACVLQLRPNMTTEQAKQFLIEHSIKDALQVLGPPGYDNTSDLQGAGNRILRMPFTNPVRGIMKRD